MAVYLASKQARLPTGRIIFPKSSETSCSVWSLFACFECMFTNTHLACLDHLLQAPQLLLKGDVTLTLIGNVIGRRTKQWHVPVGPVDLQPAGQQGDRHTNLG